MISNITIKNIKGFGDPTTSIDLEIKTNKVNVLYSPNGSGKSSLATAFASLQPRSLKVAKENMFHKNDTLDAELSIKLDNDVLVANKSKNEISSKLNVHVITSGLTTGTTHHNMGSFTSVGSYLDIADIVIVPNIPERVRPVYKISDIRGAFGTNGKILPTMDVFNDWHLWKDIETNKALLIAFNSAKSRKRLVEDIRKNIDSLKGTKDVLVSKINNNVFDALEANAIYANIISVFRKYATDDTPLGRFILLYQLLYFWEHNKETIIKANKRVKYEQFKQHVDWNLSLLDLTWKQIHAEENDGKLIVHVPQADEISNGQRDIVTLVSEMLKFGTSIKDGKKHLLIIDEVFDYLDDANVIAAQCFLTNYLKMGQGKLYLCLLTHLNPYTFKNYIFSDDKVNHQHLFKTLPIGTPAMKAFISFRQGLNRDDAVQSELYNKLSRDLFHYNPVMADYCQDINVLKTNHHLIPSWGKSQVLHNFLIAEVNKYLSNSPVYDPYAVGLSVRLRVEKLMYDDLPTKVMKDEFISTWKTVNKMKYCADNGFEMPEVYNIVNAIHNEADHLTFDANADKYIEKPMVYKLQNRSIQGLIARLFDWDGNTLTTAMID